MADAEKIAEAQRFLKQLRLQYERYLSYVERAERATPLTPSDAEQQRQAWADVNEAAAEYAGAERMFSLLHPEFKGRIATRRR